MNGFPHFDQFLAAVDRDAALAETSSRAEAALSRRGLLGVTLGAVGAIVFGKTSVAEAGAGLPASDVDILNYALVLEYLQASFYTEAERSGALSGATAQAARVVGATERAHVKAFRQLLGSRAVARPTFDFQGVTEEQRPFLKTAVGFEDLAVEAYKGQAPKLRSNAVLAAAVGIHSVEARHAAWIRYIAGEQPAVEAFDRPSSKEETLRLVRETRFVVSRPRTSAQKAPPFTG